MANPRSRGSEVSVLPFIIGQILILIYRKDYSLRDALGKTENFSPFLSNVYIRILFGIHI